MSVDNYDAAEKTFIQAITLNQNSLTPRINLGTLYLSERRFDESLSELNYALDIDSNSSSLLFNLGLCHLLLGRFISGWKYYEQRFNTTLVPRSCFPTVGPRVHSIESLLGCQSTIVVWGEQGLGDTIQFIRYLPVLQSLNIDFIFCCDERLISLLRDWSLTSFPVYPLQLSKIDSRPHCPLLSLPHILGTTESTIPSIIPYFKRPSDIPSNLQIPDVLVVWLSDWYSLTLVIPLCIAISQFLLQKLCPFCCNLFLLI